MLQWTRLLFPVIAALLLSACATVVDQKPGFSVTSNHGLYRVHSPDRLVTILINPKAGEYRPQNHTADAFFINHDYAPGSSYGARVGFANRQGEGTGLRLMNEEDIQAMVNVDGRQKRIENQRLSKIGEWDVLYYSYPMPYESGGFQYQDTMQTMLAVKRAGRLVASVEHFVSYDSVHDTKYENALAVLLQDYRVVGKTANAGD